MNKSSFISLSAIVNRIVSVLFGLDYSTFEAVNSNDIKSLNLSVPSFKEQQKIATVLANADKEIELLEQQLADLQQEKKALMQVLLTGKKRVVVEGELK